MKDFFFILCGIITVMSSSTFYAAGLRFGCTQCSRCCRHDSGYVFLSENDLDALLRRLKTDRQSFIQRYCTWVPLGFGKQLSLAEQENNDCVFWTDGGCSVYEDRPLQCRTYPFWQHVLEDEAGWKREGKECPGIGIGRTYSQEEIDECLASRRNNRSIRSK
jgi:Fe-S-cluster containining protein